MVGLFENSAFHMRENAISNDLSSFQWLPQVVACVHSIIINCDEIFAPADCRKHIALVKQDMDCDSCRDTQIKYE